MSAQAVFHLEPTGPPVRCDFPRCVLEAFHDGDHHLAPIERVPNQPIFTCQICSARFVIYGQVVGIERKTCGSQECILAAARREHPGFLPTNCRCRQRPYPHELPVHSYLKHECPRDRWPWSLMRGENVGPV